MDLPTVKDMPTLESILNEVEVLRLWKLGFIELELHGLEYSYILGLRLGYKNALLAIEPHLTTPCGRGLCTLRSPASLHIEEMTIPSKISSKHKVLFYHGKHALGRWYWGHWPDCGYQVRRHSQRTNATRQRCKQVVVIYKIWWTWKIFSALHLVK
jgi:hypothetical protein